MSTAPIDDLLQACLLAGNSDGDAYAVLDGCSAADLPQRLRAAGAEFWCLLSDGLDPVLTECAPYLVRLHPEAAAVTALLRADWGRHSGIALCAPAGSDGWSLREHLRGSLRIPAPGGRTQFFRFYDPRVLRALLPVMAPERRSAFLAPLGRLYVEGASPGTLIEFRSDGCAEGRLLETTRRDGVELHATGVLQSASQA